ncbi:hypothetical protein NXS19_006123 [Fusarium pseudograminearum]|nr:hypothetical protein NXS19_006123 [Fusarium pseudograminearum]
MADQKRLQLQTASVEMASVDKAIRTCRDSSSLSHGVPCRSPVSRRRTIYAQSRVNAFQSRAGQGTSAKSISKSTRRDRVFWDHSMR